MFLCLTFSLPPCTFISLDVDFVVTSGCSCFLEYIALLLKGPIEE